MASLSPLDPSSYSRPELVIVTKIHLDLDIDFTKRILHGRVDLTLEKIDKTVTEFILDTKNLKIFKILKNPDCENEKLKFEISSPYGEFGSKLTIYLPTTKNDPDLILSIYYETSPGSSGLQWLNPNQTAGKKYPYLFSQFQPIHARSVFPCQDTPAVKTKYTAKISARKDLTVLMSAIAKSTKISGERKISNFTQNIPLPSSLVAIAVGNLDRRRVGPRSHVWAEREIIENCAPQFLNTEKILKTAESICGPYLWEVYDLLVLPPSFPLGAMENPCLTFMTPTLLGGGTFVDNAIAHEISHSWSGNLVTSRNFEHYWLNEGFTVFLERRIKSKLISSKDQDFDALTNVSELQETVDLLGKDSPLTKLVVDLKGVDPDDAYSLIPYEKGQTLLRYLEDTVGGPEVFEPFLKHYFNHFKQKSIDSDDFKNLFLTFFEGNEGLGSIDWDSWFYSPGMPVVIPKYDTTLADVCDNLIALVTKWDEVQGFPIDSRTSESLTGEQVVYFLQKFLESKVLGESKLLALEAVFHFGKNKNAEIRFRWYRLGLQAHCKDVVAPVLQWLEECGRMKFVRPLYRDLYAWEEFRQTSIEHFEKNKKCMMHVVAHAVERDLHLCE